MERKRFGNLFMKATVWAMALVVLLGCSVMVTGCGSGSEGSAGDEPTAEDSIYGNEALGIDPAVDEALAGYRNIAVYGLDSNHNSDIIMVFSLHKDSNKAKVFAIYDKTLVKSGEELMPLSEVYSQGMETSLAAINRTFDLNVYEAVAFDRPTIKKIVQLVHGPAIDLPEGDGGMTPEAKATRDVNAFEALFVLAQKAETEQNLEVFEQVADDMESNMNKNRMTGLLEDIAKHEIELYPGTPEEYEEVPIIEVVKADSEADGSEAAGGDAVSGATEDDGFTVLIADDLEDCVEELHETIFGQEDYQVSDAVKEFQKEIDKRVK